MGETAFVRPRNALCVLIVFVLLMTVLPTAIPSSSDEKRSAETLANGSRVLNVGVIDYTGSISTLNPFVYTTSAEYQTFWPCYSTLLTYDVEGGMIGDLATSWSLAPDSVTWNFKLAQNARFVDPANPTSTAHAVTAADVIWTLWDVNNDTRNHLSQYFIIHGVGIIQAMWTGTNQWDLFVQTKSPYAPFLNALTSIPIVPEYIWGHLTGTVTPITYRNMPLVGSGPFYCTMTTLPAMMGVLKRNPQWFQEANRGWQIHVDTLQLKNEMNAAQAWNDLTASPPLIDVCQNLDRTQYITNLVDHSTPGVIGWGRSTGFVYEYQLNQLSLAQKAALGMHTGSNNQLLLNSTVKLAMAMCVNKTGFIDQVLMGLGSVADSLIPDCNPWHYTYPDPVKFDPAAARSLLMSAGWAYDSLGNPATSTTVPLFQCGSINHTAYWPLSFRLMTPSTSSDWALGANLLAQWASLAGVQLSVQVLSVGQMNSAWYAGDYDTWLWDWVFSPTSDPSTDCLLVDTTMEILRWSGSFWSNATYDRLYNNSLVATDPVARRQITDQMQAMIYEDHDDQLVAYPKSLYAASTHNWNGASYGDWGAHWTLLPDQGLPWLYMQLYPNDNHAPIVTTTWSVLSGHTGAPISLSGTAFDDSGSLLYQWYWGDGEVSGWQSTATMSHAYALPGYYTAYLAAQEQGTADGFIGWNQTMVTISGDNSPPTFDSPPIAYSPSNSINTATLVTFTASASDPEGDPITYSWDFGDGTVNQGQVASHTFQIPGLYTVTVSVTDGMLGPGRPLTASVAVVVSANHPPQLSMPSAGYGWWKSPTTFTASASDPDGDPMRFTWVWGDTSTTVTTSPFAVHTYTKKGAVPLVVHADDLTGIAGHNVSATQTVTVVDIPNPPVLHAFTANTTSILAGRSVMFVGSASDPQGYPLTMNFTFGDGHYAVILNDAAAPDALVTDTVNHTYSTGGSMTAMMTVSNGYWTLTSGNQVITVTTNNPPVVSPLVNKTANAGAPVSFAVGATDPDGDAIRCTWDFGDGSAQVVAQSTSHTYGKAGRYTFKVFVDDLTGLPGHNVSSSASIRVAFNLMLVAGWNMISLPVIGYGYKASTLGLAVGDVVAPWDPLTQRNGNMYICGISPPSYDFPILASTGYWVWVAASRNIHLYGDAPTTWQSKTVTVPASGGWVALGLSTPNTGWHASDLAGLYNSTGKLVTVAYFDPVTKKYQMYLPGLPLNDFALLPGVGYWCWVTASGTFSYPPSHPIGL